MQERTGVRVVVEMVVRSHNAQVSVWTASEIPLIASYVVITYFAA